MKLKNIINLLMIFLLLSYTTEQKSQSKQPSIKKQNKETSSCYISFYEPEYELIDKVNLLTMRSKDNQVKIKFIYDGAIEFRGGLAGVIIDGKFGYVDKSGKVIIKPKFDYVSYFSEDFAKVYIDYKMGFIDRSGKPISQIIFNDAGDFKEGLTWVRIAN
jgi:hypothetical protein